MDVIHGFTAPLGILRWLCVRTLHVVYVLISATLYAINVANICGLLIYYNIMSHFVLFNLITMYLLRHTLSITSQNTL